MNVLERIQKLCKQHGIGIAKMERDIGLSKGASYKWKNSDPSMDVLKKLSDYFDVPADFILTGQEKPMDIAVEIQRLINHLTGDNSSYCNGKIMSKEGELALLNSLKQDVEFLNALYKNDNK